MAGERESGREGREGRNEVGRVIRREGVREGITKGGGCDRREGERWREGRKEVWSVTKAGREG